MHGTEQGTMEDAGVIRHLLWQQQCLRLVPLPLTQRPGLLYPSLQPLGS